MEEVIKVFIDSIMKIFTSSSTWFWIIATSSSYLLIFQLEKNSDKYGLKISDKFIDYFAWTAPSFAALIAIFSTAPSGLAEEWMRIWNSNDSDSFVIYLGFCGYVFGMFIGLFVINIIIVYLEIILIAGLKSFHNLINKL